MPTRSSSRNDVVEDKISDEATSEDEIEDEALKPEDRLARVEREVAELRVIKQEVSDLTAEVRQLTGLLTRKAAVDNPTLAKVEVTPKKDPQGGGSAKPLPMDPQFVLKLRGYGVRQWYNYIFHAYTFIWMPTVDSSHKRLRESSSQNDIMRKNHISYVKWVQQLSRQLISLSQKGFALSL